MRIPREFATGSGGITGADPVDVACRLEPLGLQQILDHVVATANSLGHVFGYQNYETGDSSRNNLLFALMSNGDGWHNNHTPFNAAPLTAISGGDSM